MAHPPAALHVRAAAAQDTHGAMLHWPVKCIAKLGYLTSTSNFGNTVCKLP